MIDTRIDTILRRVGHGKTTYADEIELRRYIEQLQQQIADKTDKARREGHERQDGCAD